jgi:lauroyl/myristoyl acyltransferase
VQALIWCADCLPWPYSEDAIAAAYRLRWLARPVLQQRAMSWARQYRTREPEQRALARALVTNLGRFVAMDSLAGVHHPDVRRRHARIDGEAHLQDALRRGGVLLLGFHAGPPGGWLQLRLKGYRVMFAGGRSHRRWARESWRPFLDPADHMKFSESLGLAARAAGLMRARRVLLDGGSVFMTADGSGTEIFRIPLAGAKVSIRSGWWVLRRETGAAVIPVFGHLEGRTQVVTLHPPLPAAAADAEQDGVACRAMLAQLLEAHVRQYPEQCVGYALRVWG